MALIPTGSEDVGDGIMALRAEGDEIAFNILLAQSVVGGMVHLKPIAAPIVMAGSAAVIVSCKPLLSFGCP